ncbi:beta-adaptin-like protein A [Fagus crenata]
MGNDQTCEILGIGKIKLKLHDGTVRFLTGVRYIRDFKKNLISVGLLESKGFKIAMENGTLKILNGALVVMMATRHRNLYLLKGSTVVGGAATVSDIIGELASDTTRLLGHADDSALQRLMEQDLLKDVKTCKFEFCELCILGKQIRVKLGIAVHLINGTLDYVHTYVWGLTKVASFGGRNYFVNDYSRQVWVKGTTDLDLMFDVLFRFVCEFFEEGDTLLQKIGTAEVPWHKFRHCLDLFGICNLD